MQCSFAVLGRVIFAVDETDLAEGEDVLSIVRECQISCIADIEGLKLEVLKGF